MKFLRILGVGDKFRPAHPQQPSLNKRQMSRDTLYRVTRVYSQSPYVVISVEDQSPDSGIYSLGAGTPVLFPKEPNPSIEDITKFLAPRSNKRVVAYRLLWDGKVDLAGVVQPQAASVLRLLFAFGKKEYTLVELNQLFNEHFERFSLRPTKMDGFQFLNIHRRHLVNQGLLAEVVDLAPKTRAVSDANLQEVM
jgi:hypothetical protein